MHHQRFIIISLLKLTEFSWLSTFWVSTLRMTMGGRHYSEVTGVLGNFLPIFERRPLEVIRRGSLEQGVAHDSVGCNRSLIVEGVTENSDT